MEENIEITRKQIIIRIIGILGLILMIFVGLFLFMPQTDGKLFLINHYCNNSLTTGLDYLVRGYC